MTAAKRLLYSELSRCFPSRLSIQRCVVLSPACLSTDRPNVVPAYHSFSACLGDDVPVIVGHFCG